MTGKAIVFMGRRGFTLFATMLVVLVLGDRLEMLRWPSVGRDSTMSGHPDPKGITNQRSFVAIVYADAQQGPWREESEESAEDTRGESVSSSLVRQDGRRGRSASGRGRRNGDPFHKRYAKELMMSVAALVGLLAVFGGYKYFWGAQKGSSSTQTNEDGSGRGGSRGQRRV